MSPTVFFALTIDALTIAACLFAWWKGESAERWGGTINLIAATGAVIARLVLHAEIRDVTVLIADGVLAFGLLFLGVRYASLWIGAAMLLQAVQFLLHTYYFVLEVAHDRLFSLVNNLVSLGVILCICGGTMLTWQRRTRRAAV